jgi:hypothetical protein
LEGWILIRCNYCFKLFPNDTEFSTTYHMTDDGSEVCPACGKAGHLMDMPDGCRNCNVPVCEMDCWKSLQAISEGERRPLSEQRRLLEGTHRELEITSPVVFVPGGNPVIPATEQEAAHEQD